MTTTTTILCDQCEHDLTYTNNTVDYRLILASQPKTHWYVGEGKETGAVTLMHIQNPMPQSRHFCGLHCLKEWIAENV